MEKKSFLEKFNHKTNEELEEIIRHSKKYRPEAVQAAKKLLKSRDPDTELVDDVETNDLEVKKIDKHNIRVFEVNIKKKHSFWKLKYSEDFRTDLNSTTFIALTKETFENLDWDIVFLDDTSVEAKRKNDWEQWTEKIIVTYLHGKIVVESKSLKGSLWDAGRNSQRVKLFIHVFDIIKNSYSQDELNQIEQDTKSEVEWDDYEIPDSLPQPKTRKEPEIYTPIIGGVIISLLLGLAIAFLSIEGLYIIGIFELAVGFILGLAFKYLIPFSNYTNHSRLNYLLAVLVFIIYLSNQYFEFLIISSRNVNLNISLWEFMEYRFYNGLTIKSLDVGSIGLVILWIFQLVFTYLMGSLRLGLYLTNYQFERVPSEVIDFCMYHFVKEKSESEVRYELTQKGWSKTEDQNDVFEAIAAIYSSQEIRRMD